MSELDYEIAALKEQRARLKRQLAEAMSEDDRRKLNAAIARLDAEIAAREV